MRTLAEIIAAVKREESENVPDTDILQNEEPIAENSTFSMVPIKQEPIDDEEYAAHNAEIERESELHDSKRSRDEEPTTTNKRSRHCETEETPNSDMQDLTANEKLQSDYQDLKRKLETSDGRNRELQEQLEAGQKEKKQFLTDFKKLQLDFQSLQQMLETSHHGKRELEAKHGRLKYHYKTEIKKIEEAKKTIESEIQLLRDANEKMRKETETAKQDAKDQLTAKVNEIQQLRSESEEVRNAMENAKQCAEDQLKAKVNEIQQLRSENAELFNATENSKQYLADYVKTKNMERQGLEGQLRTKADEINYYKTEIKKSKEVKKNNESEIKVLRNKNAGLRKMIQDYLEAKESAKKDAEDQLKAKTNEIEQLRSQNEELRKLVPNTESHNEEPRKLVLDGNDAKESLDADERKWHTRFLELHKGMQRAEDDLEAMREANQTLEGQLKTKVDENLQLNILVQNANDAKNYLEGYSQKLFLECFDLHKECLGLLAELHNLEATEKENTDSVIQEHEVEIVI